MIQFKIINANGEELFCEKGNSIDTVYNGEYSPGDKIVISKTDTEYLALKLDDMLQESIIFAPISTFEFPIPYGDLLKGYAPDAFSGKEHKIKIYEPEDEVKYGSRNISLNSHDLRGQNKFFPHGFANIVTREAVCFYERNAIDGVTDNQGHGNYPYHSWAGGAREDLEYFIDFGTEVEVEKVIFYLFLLLSHNQKKSSDQS